MDLQIQPIRRIAFISIHGCPLVVPGEGSAGGMNVYLKKIAPLLVDRGICVDIFTKSHESQTLERNYLRENLRVIHVPVEDHELEKEKFLPSIPFITEWIKSFAEQEQFGYDLVHSHYWLSGLVGESIAKYFAIPHAITYHTIGLVKESHYDFEEPNERKTAEASISETADKIMAFTAEEAGDIQNLFSVPTKKISIAQGGVDLGLFHPSDPTIVRRALSLGDDQKIILYVGRLDPFKGPDILLKSIAEIPRAVLVIVGGAKDDDGKKWLKKLSVDLGIQDKVIFLSAMPQEFLPSYYSAADILAIPSYHESFGLVGLEAMACGTPIVAANVGSLRTLVEDGVTGFLINEQKHSAYTQAFNRLLNEQNHSLHSMREAAINFVATKGWEQSVDQLLTAYSEMIKLKGSNPKVVSCVA